MTENTGPIKPGSEKHHLMIMAKCGFTLIELIVIIMLLGLMAAIIVPFTGPALTESHRPMENLDHAGDLNAEMAKVIAEYRITEPDNEASMEAFENSIPGLIDGSVVDITVNELVMFEQDVDEYSETSCDPPESLDCTLKVRLESLANPGENLTYYFSYKR